jgi:hypothetical protein
MSLISGANFVAPLRSKVQIVGIFALAVLVAVLRLAGSGHTSEDGSGSSEARGYGQAAPKTTMVADDVDAYLASRRHTKGRTDQSGTGDITVERLLQGQDSDTDQRVAPQANDEAASQPEKLNDIKRSLGLE